MKRSEVVQILRNAVLTHMNCEPLCCDNDEVMYGRILSALEEAGFCLVDDEYGVCGYAPEEGWDAWLEEKDRKEQLRDFHLVPGGTVRSQVIAAQFLGGASFDDLAKEYNVTRERIRQIVAKERRRYQKSREEK